MPPKRPPSDAMTLRELGITDLDCGLDPDGFLDGPPADAADAADGLSVLEAGDLDDPSADDDGLR